MTDRLIDIEGIGSAFARTLRECGLTNTDDLLDVGGSSAGRKRLAAITGIEEPTILEWVNRADLMRVKGIGSEYSDLLEAAGVTNVEELARRVPAKLAARLIEVNAAKNLVRRVPSESEVTSWVSDAKSLPVLVKSGAGKLPSMRRVPPSSEDSEIIEADRARRLAAFHRAAGSWSDIDTDKLIEDIYDRRRGGNRGPVEL